MDGAALIAVDCAGRRVLDRLDVRQLPGLLVIFNAVSLLVPFKSMERCFGLPFANLEVQRAAQSIGKVGEKFSLEHAIKKRVWFLSTDHQREPVILQVRSADGLDGTKGNGTLGCNDQLVVDDTLSHNVHMTVGLTNC